MIVLGVVEARPDMDDGGRATDDRGGGKGVALERERGKSRGSIGIRRSRGTHRCRWRGPG